MNKKFLEEFLEEKLIEKSISLFELPKLVEEIEKLYGNKKDKKRKGRR